MREVAFVLGTRAEAIKILPLVRELERRGRAYKVVSTGQHDLAEFGFARFVELRRPRGVSGTFRSPVEGFLFSVSLVPRIRSLVKGCIVVVQGDTMSTAAGALAGRLARGATVCHVESGLRTFDLLEPFPEEISRVIADSLSHLHFAPTERSAGVTPRSTTHLVGNTVIDSIKARGLRVRDGGFVLFSIHRQENINSPAVMKKLVQRLEETAKRYKVKFVLSQNTRRRLEQYGLMAAVEKRAEILPVLPYEKFLPLLASCTAVVSDSGGLAEECAFLGKPLVIFRRKTERSESVEHGYALLGFDFDLAKFVKGFSPRRRHIYGRGDSAKKIVDVLEGVGGGR
ncbi:MAG: UDP-N-acetylglucosamine 2-epimerase [Candidatus Micrarchaeota archaeon]